MILRQNDCPSFKDPIPAHKIRVDTIEALKSPVLRSDDRFNLVFDWSVEIDWEWLDAVVSEAWVHPEDEEGDASNMRNLCLSFGEASKEEKLRVSGRRGWDCRSHFSKLF